MMCVPFFASESRGIRLKAIYSFRLEIPIKKDYRPRNKSQPL